jgi:hypothetical protein
MNKPLANAITRLTDVLDRENRALTAMDLVRAAALLGEKSLATADLQAMTETPAHPDPALVPLVRQLDTVTRENTALLRRAITAQHRVIGIVVAAVASVAVEPTYGGRRARIAAMAMSTRA